MEKEDLKLTRSGFPSAQFDLFLRTKQQILIILDEIYQHSDYLPPLIERTPYCLWMFDSWKFSKGSYLIIIFTGGAGLLVLSFAYHLQRYSEILSGIIGGLTIITGMIIAEWLRAARTQVEQTRSHVGEAVPRMQSLIYNAEYWEEGEIMAYRNEAHYKNFILARKSLMALAETTRWPQPNAMTIRQLAHELDVKLYAMHRDAYENGHIWSVDKRLGFFAEVGQLIFLVWATEESGKEFLSEVAQARDTPKNDGIPTAWKSKLLHE